MTYSTFRKTFCFPQNLYPNVDYLTIFVTGKHPGCPFCLKCLQTSKLDYTSQQHITFPFCCYLWKHQILRPLILFCSSHKHTHSYSNSTHTAINNTPYVWRHKESIDMLGGKEVLCSVSVPNHLSILQGEPFRVVSYFCEVIHQVL